MWSAQSPSVEARPPSATICLTLSFRSPLLLAAGDPLSSTIQVIAVRSIATAPFGAPALRQRWPSPYASATLAGTSAPSEPEPGVGHQKIPFQVEAPELAPLTPPTYSSSTTTIPRPQALQLKMETRWFG